MIRIDLVDKTNNIKHIDFNVVPVAEEKDFTCLPEDILPFPASCGFPVNSRQGVWLGKSAYLFGIG